MVVIVSMKAFTDGCSMSSVCVSYISFCFAYEPDDVLICDAVLQKNLTLLVLCDAILQKNLTLFRSLTLFYRT